MTQEQTAHNWFQYYPKDVAQSYRYSEKALSDYLGEVAERNPDEKAVQFMGTNVTYKEVYDQARRFANALQSKGVVKGDRVAIMLANTPQSVICYYGAMLAGAVVVQTNPLYVEREIEHQMVDSGAKVLVCLDMVFPRVQKVRNNTQLEHVFVAFIKDYLPFPKNLIYPFIQKKNLGMKIEVDYDEQTHNLKQALEATTNKYKKVDISPREDLALIQYTGGTTGTPKGVMLTHYNLVVNTEQCTKWTYRSDDPNPHEKVLAVLPFFHVYGMTVALNLAVMNGYTLVILPKFDPKQVLQTIEKHKVTLFPGAPTMYTALVNHPDIDKHDLSSIKVCLSGAAPLPKEIQKKFEEKTKGRLIEGYGLTETAPVAASNPIWENRRNGSIGLPWPDTELAILDSETGEFLETDQVGEIIIRGPQVMQGYWKREEATKAVFHEDWFKSGDMGYQDKDGYFYIVDRKKDMIIAGGFNIYLREVEEVLYEHDAILECAVVGVPDEYRGETVKAFVVTKTGKEVTEEALESFCRERLAAYKIPRIYEFRNELPKTLVGKVLRRVLVEEEQKKAEEALLSQKEN
ncbi:LOW QUALITY PROTEIN: long-chain-fatty-acid-CoA ligase [Geomicrobium sp. JCM 19055]|nr:LOW QUALITY PROTEIN: long-chain-fatty-acid-CoA ligase [Geomicrobium sp. JCM 19055]